MENLVVVRSFQFSVGRFWKLIFWQHGWVRWWRGGGRDGKTVDGVWFHEFDAGAVGVVEVQLVFAVDAGLDLQGARVVYFCGAVRSRYKNGNCILAEI